MTLNTRWKKILRRTFRVLAVVAGLVLLAWIGLAWYINTHKQEILAKVTDQMGDRMRGDLKIADMEPSLLRNFPNVSLALKNVTLRDSMWATHHHSLLEASDIFVQINPVALLSRRVEIGKITAAHGNIYVYTDSNSYSNTYLLESRDTSKTNRTALVERFGLDDMHLWFVNEDKKKLFHLYFDKMNGTSRKENGIMEVRINTDAHIHELNFNTSRGSFAHEQDLDMDMLIRYHQSNKRMEIPDQKIRIGGEPVFFGAEFAFNVVPATFAVRIHTDGIKYKKAVSWMSPNIRRILDSFDFSKPVALDARISGATQGQSNPLVNVTYRIENNTLSTRMGTIENLSYDGIFMNEAVPGAGNGDDNSRVSAYGLKGTWNNLPFEGDTISVTNLIRPVVKAHIKSNFKVPAINDLVGGNVMSFDKGTAAADLYYNGGILPDDPTPYSINGFVKITDAGMTYIPRSLQFSNVGATLLFKDDNLYFRDITLRSKNSSISMEGDALHFLRLYFADPGKVTLDWRIRSPLINLNDFIGFVGKRKSASAPTRSRSAPASVTRIGNQLDQVLAASSISLDARLDKMIFKKFTGNGVIAQATIAQSGLILRKVQVNNGGGSVTISGTVNQTAPNNPFIVKAEIRNEDVAKLFRDFDNFGQTAITADNLEGRINADANVRGNVTESGSILKNSLNGTVTFDLKDGQINRFSPFEKVGKFVFKKRNLSAVAVRNLRGQLDLNGNKIAIHPMEIQTSVVNMNVQGIYGLQGGTDIYLEIPLRNPEKEEAATMVGRLMRRGKGLVVNLRAQDETGTGVKIGWDPRKKGLDATTEKLSDD